MPSPVVANAQDHNCARIITYRGVISTGNPWDVTGGGVKTPTASNPTVTGVTTTVPDTLIVQAIAWDLDNAGPLFSAETNANLTNIAERADAGSTTANGGGFAVWDGGKAVAGATGNTTTTAISSINAFLTIALKPKFHFLVEAAAGGNIGPQTAGTSFNIKITAQDSGNNTVSGFTGTADITSTGTLSAGGGTTPGFTAGVLASRSVTISNTGCFTITATKTGFTETGTSNAFTVSAAVADASYVAANAQNGQVIVYWSSPNPVLILRKPGAFSGEAPVNGTTYTAGSTIGGATVASVGSGVATSFTETIANGTLYYKVFAMNGACYSPGTVNATSGVNASPAASPQTWSYAMAGGSILKGGIAGTGAVYSSSNASWIASLSTANGAQSWAPVATTAAIQGWLSPIPISGGGGGAVAFVQNQRGTNSCQTTSAVTITPTSAITAGNLVVVAVSDDTSGSTVTSVKDNNLVAYTPLTSSAYSASTGKMQIWYKENAPAATSITATWSGSVAFGAASMVEYSGVATSGALDAQNTATGSSLTPTVSLTTSKDNDLLYAATVNNSGTVSAGTGYAPRNVDDGNCINDEDKLTNTTGSNSATFNDTLNVGYAIAMAAFKAASGAAVIGGDQSGKVYSVDATTGVTNWTANLQPSGADAVQAAVSAQLRQYSNAAFQSTYTTDVIFAATRNASSTNNKLFALKASDGSVLWSFNGTVSTGNNVDYIVGQPWVDYARNYVYIASRAGIGGAQSSVWVINSLNGNLVASSALGTNVHLQTSLTLSQDGKTLYVSDTSGNLYALDTTTLPASLGNKWSSPAALGAAIADTSFIWENNTTVSSGGAIAFDATSSPPGGGVVNPTLSLSWSHTVTGSNPVLFVSVSSRASSAVAPTVSSITYNGVALTKVTSNTVGGQNDLELWVLAAPATGAHTVAITMSNGGSATLWGISAEATSYTGVAQTNPVDVSNNSSGSTASVSVGWTTVASNTWAIAAGMDQGGNTLTFSAGANQTPRWNSLTDASAYESQSGADQSAISSPASVTFTWTMAAAHNWIGVGASFKAAGGAPVPADLLYFSTVDGYLWCLQDLGAGAPPSVTTPCTGWSAVKTAVPGPSTPLLLNKLFVGSWNGTLGQIYQINPSTGAIEKQVTVGDGTKQPGDVSTETGNEIFVGTSEGTIFKFPLTGGNL